ncbi:hypothetical protein NKI01_28965 [Mesorhizobium sp. M0815]|uniref:hypothetical protein n=1 Tax=Mesorhizobium sp. M0815 TaxID=2957005 RepID=UPI003339C7D1
MASNSNKLWCAASYAAIALLVSGCAAVDAVSPRATSFNQQAADAKSDSILTNIVRAAYAEPLQFTELSSTAGTGSVSGSVGAGVPFPFRGGTGALPLQTITSTFNASSTVGNTFAVQNISTQDFYQGIQKPIPKQLILSWISEGFDPRVVMNLFVSGIEVTQNGKTKVIQNNPESYNDWNAFYSAVNQLAFNNLDSEKTSSTTPVSTDLTRAEASKEAVLAALINAPAGAPSFEKNGNKVRLVKHEAGYRFCFRAAPGEPKSKTVELADDTFFQLYPSDYCSETAKKSDDRINIRTRSVEGAIFYLGQMVRNQWGMGGSGQNLFQIPHGGNTQPYTVFKLDKGLRPNNLINVWYKGQVYGIARDPAGLKDGSSRVLQLLTDALNLQSSSKDVPAPSIITLVGG